MVRHVGVDGCRFGWVAVFEDRGELCYRLFRRFDELVSVFPAADILVDIPIGLPWNGCSVRPCDSLARKHLGAGRASSVFPAPCRSACSAVNIDEARRRNQAELGKSLSAQAWGICPKVAEVDAFLLLDQVARLRVREIHPEVCFWALNGQLPMPNSKKTVVGGAERVSLLSRYEPRSQQLLEKVLREQWRRDIQPDDVLDALVGFVTASAAPATIQRLQCHPKRDQKGLPMEMLYVQP